MKIKIKEKDTDKDEEKDGNDSEAPSENKDYASDSLMDEDEYKQKNT